MWITTVTTFVLGYMLGKGSLSQNNVDKTVDIFKRQFKDKRVGGIKRPTAEQLYERNNPILKAGNDEMRKSLEELNR